ncbi:hypothetical protein COLO4_25042 [Corchorus olitorius]|uniref:Uncharacterized protein n=1 Tax=Corchorus olitorius TaxID=93759 RepID=A0A1R3I4Z4_9ROSI|nr:hypothetical protein COLO4_25042 [Corchorus olitorius]
MARIAVAVAGASVHSQVSHELRLRILPRSPISFSTPLPNLVLLD